MRDLRKKAGGKIDKTIEQAGQKTEKAGEVIQKKAEDIKEKSSARND